MQGRRCFHPFNNKIDIQHERILLQLNETTHLLNIKTFINSVQPLFP